VFNKALLCPRHHFRRTPTHVFTHIFLCALCGSLSSRADGYLGLSLRDIRDGHTVVSWISPGPLDGSGLESESFDLQRPDLIVSIDGKSMNAHAFGEHVKSLAPGTTVRIAYRPSRERGPNIPDEISHEDETKSIEVVVADEDEWTGTIQRGRSIMRDVHLPAPLLLDPHDRRSVLSSVVAEKGLLKPVETLLGVFRKWDEDAPDYHMLPHVRKAFQYPFALVELAETMSLSKPREDVLYGGQLSLRPNPIRFVQNLIRDFLDMEGMGGSIGMSRIGPDARTAAGKDLMLKLTSAKTWRQFAFYPDFDEAHGLFTAGFPTSAIEFLRVPKRTFYISGPDAKDDIGVIRASMGVNWAAFGNALLDFEREHFDIDVNQLRTMPLVDPPDTAKGIIEGTVIETIETRLGWVVVGGPGPNRYDMSKVIGVYDLGGDDEYFATALCIGNRTITDLEGDDRYSGTPDQGPASAILGTCFLDDRAGDDRYEGELLSAGAAIYGVSLLLDRGGNDTYTGSEWSLGAACYGAGVIVDLGDGADTYTGQFLCQGVGGPRGFGAIIDEGGNDTYTALGNPSVYGMDGVDSSFSQGIGFGFRGYAAGGIGMISDLGGDDVYQAGEFSQGGAYYYSLGILHDAMGNDRYTGNRYSQGFGVHQAHGILADDAGDDVYVSATAASQGAAWDIGAGLLIDRSGDDSYTCDGLGQGGASMQGIAMLLDLGGTDSYTSRGGATQGESGGNSYHFLSTGAFSFSLLLDLGGKNDTYSTGRANNAVMITGTRNDADPQHSGLHGVVIDR